MSSLEGIDLIIHLRDVLTAYEVPVPTVYRGMIIILN